MKRQDSHFLSFDGNGNVGDVFTGWVTGGGAYGSPQAQMAALFYQAVNGGNAAGNANIILTSHSLGGGLAGLIGKVYGVNALMFDNMPFELAANRLWTSAQITDHYDPNGVFLGSYADDPAARALFYQNANPAPLVTSGLSGIYT